MTTPASFDTSDIVQVTAVVSPTAATPPFGRTLFLTDDNIDSVQPGRVAEYPTLAAMSDFAPTDPPRLAGTAYFNQPGIKPPLLVGKWVAPTDQEFLRGGAIQQDPAEIGTREAALSGTVLQLGSATIDAADLVLTSPNGYPDIATRLATAINGLSGYTNATVTYVAAAGSNGRFDVDFGTTGAPVVFANGAAGNIADDLGLSAAAGAYLEHPEGEAAATNLDAILAANPNWYFLTLDPSLRDTRAVLDDNPGANDIGLATVLNSNERMLIMDTAEDDALVVDETTSYAARVAALELGRNAIIWSKRDYIGTALAARFSAVDYTGRNTLINAWGKSLAGFTADTMTLAQKNELLRKRVNAYTRVGGQNIIQNGAVPGNDNWMDQRIALDWFINACRHRIFQFFTSSLVGIPRDTRGQADLLFAVSDVCQDFVRNGGIGPGQLTPAQTSEVAARTGDAEFDGYLTTGYRVWAESVALQTPSERAARRAPPIYIWLFGRGFFQGASIAIALL